MATALELTGTEVSAYSFSPMSARRTHTHIRRSDLESYFLFLVHGSPIGLEQRRNNTLLKAGDMAVFDTSQPLECEFQDHGRASRVTLMRQPRSVLPLPGDGMDRLVATPLSVRAGSGALLTSFLAGFRANATQENLPELQRLGATGLELAATLLAAHLDTSPALPVETRRTVLLARINAFIDQNLPDPDLSPATVAAHHHISVRLLHLMFRQEPETVAAAIRRRRLERGRADLADPRLRHRTIAGPPRAGATVTRPTSAGRSAAPTESRPATTGTWPRALTDRHGAGRSGRHPRGATTAGSATGLRPARPRGRLRSRCRATSWRASHPAGSCAPSRPGRNR
ncbi:AraC family transcriptional regulator [Streptomyces bobili]|uniref:AraC family transcriptional regulator n=1 Tax=Streptomyces bobili TaxID=67280 RepID=UPI0036E4277C